MSPDAAYLRVEHLSKTYSLGAGLFGKPRSFIQAVDDVSFHVAKGKTLGLVGESGCGKSTVGRMLLRLLPPSNGEVHLGDLDVMRAEGDSLRLLRRRMQIVFQDPYGSLNPKMRVADAILEPLEIHQPHMPRGQMRQRAEGLLNRVGLRPEQASRFPAQFSGGQRQRIAIARALAVDPEFIFADEPVSALDVSIQAQILNLLMDLQQERGLTYLFVSHDLKVIEHVADEVAVMYLGRIVERSPTAELFAKALHPYTQALLSAIPDPRPNRKRTRILLEGEVPSPAAPPSGCPFHPRCPLYKRLSPEQQGRCRVERPLLESAGGGRTAACHFADQA